ncbi:hypothetical protein [Schlesneria paludicola]|uniref:hypothetical protein n=1 Tax=Schlesneria paludicola TaxID=360056 RepID=UPI00029B045C|nr:hypothetical protein [Schlesneria paludicola]
MPLRSMISLFAWLLVVLALTSTAKSDQGDTATNQPQAPAGFVVIEEDRWYLMSDEPGLHIGRAREAFLMLDAKTAAAELRKAAVHFRIEATSGTERMKRRLIHAEHELEHAAHTIEIGTMKSVEELDLATARAMHALSESQYVKATEAWEKKEVRRAGYFLRATADNLEHAAARTEHRMKATTAQIARESRAISGNLIEGTGYVVDEVGLGFEKVGNQLERVGARVAPPSTK